MSGIRENARLSFRCALALLAILTFSTWSLADCGDLRTVSTSCSNSTCSDSFNVGACALGNSPCYGIASLVACCSSEVGSADGSGSCGLMCGPVTDSRPDHASAVFVPGPSGGYQVAVLAAERR